MNDEDTGELEIPDRTNDLLSDVLIALAAAAGVAGCLTWDVGPAFYFVPLALAGAALVLLVAAVGIASQVRIGALVFATLAMLGSGWIGVDAKKDYDKLSDQAQNAIERLNSMG